MMNDLIKWKKENIKHLCNSITELVFVYINLYVEEQSLRDFGESTLSALTFSSDVLFG